MADIQTNPIVNLSEHGLIIDTAPSSIPQNAFSDGRNVRFANGAVNKMEGEVLLNSIVADSNLDTIYTGTGNKLGAAKYIAYWPNPNLGSLYGYYVYVMEVLNSNDIPLAHRVYLQDQEGNRKDLTPNITNSGGYSGFDVGGSWQHTLFSGGFAIILNNGIQKPQYVLDKTTTFNVNNIDHFHELPGWDSYNVEQQVHKDTYAQGNSIVFDLGQKVDFVNNKILVEGTNIKTVKVGSPAGTGTPNAADFVPGDLPSTIPSVTGNQFEIYTDTSTNTTVVVIGGLAIGDEVIITIESRNPVEVRCGVIRSFGELLVAGDLTEIDEVNGNTIRRLAGVVRTSDVAIPGAIPNNWNPYAAGVSTADEFTLSETNIIKDMVSLQGNMYMYTNDSIHVMKLTGNSDAPVTFAPVTDSYGALTTDSVLEYDGKHFVIGSSDIYLFPGHPANIQSVSDNRVREYFFENLSPLHEEKLFTILNFAQDEIWICFPTINSISGECDEALIWNYRDNTWTKRDLNDVISGDIAPVRGGGIPTAEITPAGTESGNDTAMNLGRQEVQTLTVTGKIRTPHTGVPQIQRTTIPTVPSYSAAGYEQIEVTVSGDAGEDTVAAQHTITFPNTTLFTRSTTISGGFQVAWTQTNNSNASTVTIPASALFPINDGQTKTGTQTATALADYINAITAGTDPIANYTATASGTTVNLVSDVVGVRSISNISATSYTSTTTSASGTGSNNGVSVTYQHVNLGSTGQFTVPGTGGTSAIPYYQSNNWSTWNNTSNSDTNGHTFPSSPDNINGLQAFLGGWTSAGAGGPDGNDLNATYTVTRQGNLYFILTGSGAGGADNNHGGGAASAARGTISAQVGDTISVTAAAANRLDLYGDTGPSGRASRIRWYRGATLLADIIAPGGKAGNNSTPAGQADQVTPTNAPSGVSNYVKFRGEGSTSSVLSGETALSGNQNGGRGYFTLNGGGSQYAGRYAQSSLRWIPSNRSWGDGTQGSWNTWNSIPPGAVFLWQDPIRTDYTITNNRTESTHPLQTEIFNLHLNAAGSSTSQDVASLSSGQSATASFNGVYTDTSWTGSIIATTTQSINTTVADPNGGTIAGSTIEIDRVDSSATYNKSITYTDLQGNGGSPSVGYRIINAGSFSFQWHNRTLAGDQNGWGTSLVRETDEQVQFVRTADVYAGELNWRWTAGYNGYTQEPFYFTIKVTGRHRTTSSGSFLTGTHYYTLTITRDNQSNGQAKASRHSGDPGNPNNTSVASGSSVVESNIARLYDMTDCDVEFYYNSYQPGTSSASFGFTWDGNAEGIGYDYRARKSTNSGPASTTVPSALTLTTSYQNLAVNQQASSINVQGVYTVANGTSSGVTATSANTATGIGYYGISAANSPAISPNISQAATANVPAIDIDLSAFPTDITAESDFSDHIVNELQTYTEFGGRDPAVPNQTQPIGAYYYVTKQSGANPLLITRVPIQAGAIRTISASFTGTSTGQNDYTGVSQASTSGSGTGATFDVSTDGQGAYLVTFADADKTNSPGSGYAVNDTITISGASLGGTTPANDLILTVTDVVAGSTNDGSLSFSFFTINGGVKYAEQTFGGNVSANLSVVQSGGGGSVTAPIVRLSYDGSNVDTILFGTNTETTIASKIALALQNTAAFTASSNGAQITATRTSKGPTTNLVSLTVISDPSSVLPSGFGGAFTELQPGQNSSTGNAVVNISLPASQFLPAQTVDVAMTGTTDTELSSSDIATLIRAASFTGWTTGGTGSTVTFTTVDNYSVNRQDNGLGTGTVQSYLYNATADDSNGLFRVYLDPITTIDAVETTAGVTIRYSEPTVYRVNYSNGDFQDFVFGGTYNGALAENVAFVTDIYNGGTSSTTYTPTQISTEFFNSIKSYAGQRLDVTRNVVTELVKAIPVQYSQNGLWISSISLLQRGTIAPAVLAVTIPVSSVDATITETIDFVSTFNPDRPWPIDQVKKGRQYPIFIQTTNNADGTVNNSRIRAADIGFAFGADPYNSVAGSPYVSYVEKRDLAISPEFNTEEVSTMALWADGGTRQVLGGPLSRATINVRMSGSNNTAKLVDLLSGADVTNQYVIGDDYKIDMRVTGRFGNFRIDDGEFDPEGNEVDPTQGDNIRAWNVSSYQFDIGQGGTR